MVNIYVEWRENRDDGTERMGRYRAEKLLYDVDTEKPHPPTPWVFVGSTWVDGRFGASLEGSLITTFYDSYTVLELSTKKVMDDTWCVVNSKLCPDAGTPVELIIEALPEAETEEAQTGEGNTSREVKDE